MQEETGEGGTDHLQGVLHWKCQVARATLQQWNPRIHWEASRSIYNSVKYCTDEDKRKPGGRVWTKRFTVTAPARLDVLDREDLYTWQKDLLTELESEPHDRQILWYCDESGGSGKTAFCKHVLKNFHRALFFNGGNFRDISHCVCKSRFDPLVVLINLPRSSEGKLSYASIEAIKDGLIQSGKYEGGFKMYAPPHVVIMANFMPQLDQLSLDRWDIRHLENNARRE